MISDNELEAFKATNGDGFFHFRWESKDVTELKKMKLENEKLRLENERLRLMLEAAQFKREYYGKEKKLPKPAMARLIQGEYNER